VKTPASDASFDPTHADSCPFAWHAAVAQGRKWRLSFHYGGTQSSNFVSSFAEFMNVKELKDVSRRKVKFQLALKHTVNADATKAILKDPQVRLCSVLYLALGILLLTAHSRISHAMLHVRT
jgi:hypothetical protein